MVVIRSSEVGAIIGGRGEYSRAEESITGICASVKET